VRRPLRPLVLLSAIGVMAALAACSSSTSGHASPAAGSPLAAAASESALGSSPVSSAATSSAAVTTAPPPAAPPSLQNASSALPQGGGLPLAYSTGSASEVITVVAISTSSTTATLQAWDKSGGGWTRHGAAVEAHLGSAGLTTHASEQAAATPIGSFAMSRAFGHDANPGTALPYHQTTPADWWVSQYGGAYASIYNTMQTCSSSCPFDTSDSASNPNEHLFYETPFYNYAVVIEYNTTAPIVQDGGSAFFLHVTNGAPTAGCVSIPQPNLVSIMQWLNPADSPRILIGVG
jgi:L,D-peptidoglycan transpeptidase YkuD (ErfK/YbiS/YcfS/YnhG family)